MNLLGSIVFALIASVVLAGVAGLFLSTFAGDSDFFAVVIVAAAVVAAVSVLPFAIASLRPMRKRAVRRLALSLTVLLIVVTFGLAAAHFGAQGTIASTWPGVKLMLVLLVACELVVLVHWLVFRREPATRMEPAMQFSRAGANGTGGKK